MHMHIHIYMYMYIYIHIYIYIYMYVCMYACIRYQPDTEKNMLLCCVLLAIAPNETAGVVKSGLHYINCRKICCVTCKRKLNLDKRR